MEFLKDGTVTVQSKDIGLVTGNYTFLEDGRLKVELDGLYALAGAMIMEWSIQDDQLITIYKGKREVAVRFDPTANK